MSLGDSGQFGDGTADIVFGGECPEAKPACAGRMGAYRLMGQGGAMQPRPGEYAGFGLQCGGKIDRQHPIDVYAE